MENDQNENIIEGILILFDETGTEGVLWSLQDKRFIAPNTTCFVCRKCFVTWNKKENPDGPTGEEFCYPSSWDHAQEYPKPCKEGNHEFELNPKVLWSKDGLYQLKDGDQLTIYNKAGQLVVWSGVINLHSYPPFKEKALGFWIHDDQKGVGRDVWARWFIDKHPAKLIQTKQH